MSIIVNENLRKTSLNIYVQTQTAGRQVGLSGLLAVRHGGTGRQAGRQVEIVEGHKNHMLRLCEIRIIASHPHIHCYNYCCCCLCKGEIFKMFIKATAVARQKAGRQAVISDGMKQLQSSGL